MLVNIVQDHFVPSLGLLRRRWTAFASSAVSFLYATVLSLRVVAASTFANFVLRYQADYAYEADWLHCGTLRNWRNIGT